MSERAFAYAVVLGLLVAGCMFQWGHWVGINDAQALMVAQAQQRCGERSAWIAPADMSVICFSGSGRRRGR